MIEGLLLHIQALAETKLMSPLLIGELTDMTLSAEYIFHVWLWVGKEPIRAAMLSKQGEVLGTGAQVHAPRSREQPASLRGGWMSREMPGCTPKTRAPLRAKLMTCPISFPERCLCHGLTGRATSAHPAGAEGTGIERWLLLQSPAQDWRGAHAKRKPSWTFTPSPGGDG